MRLSRLRFSVSVLAAVIGLTLTSAPVRAAPSKACDRREATTPEGIAVVIQLNGRHDFSYYQQAMANPYMRGVDLLVQWNDLQPTDGEPDWTLLDQIFAQAEQNRQWVQLSVFPGFFTPPWALKGVKTDTFVVPYGPYHGQTLPLPMPWDQTYLTRWFTFMRKVAKRYGSSSAFRIIGSAGPTSVSDEMTLPGEGNVKKWVADGYSPLLYLAAWDQTWRELNRDFPNQCVSVSAPSLPFYPNGTEAERLKFAPKIISSAQSFLGDRLTIQSNDLHAGQAKLVTHDQTGLIISYAGKITTGFMMRGGTEGAGPSAVMGAAGDPPLALQRSIDKGLALNSRGLHVDYLEIYIGDVMSANMQDVLKKTAKRFEHGKGN